MMTEPTKKRSGKLLKLAVGLGILALLFLAVFLYWHFFMRGVVSSQDARLQGDLVDVAPEISGILDQVFAGEGERVTKGQVLFTLKKDLLQASVAQARAELNSAKANLAAARSRYDKALSGPRAAEIRAAEAVEKRLRSQMEYAGEVLRRTRALISKDLGSQDVLDTAENSYRKAVADHDEAIQQLKLLREGTRSEDLSEASATVEAAEAHVSEASALLNKAELSLDRATLNAPFDGLVVRKWVDAGTTLTAGRPVLTIFNPASLYVSANIEEKDLHRVKIGDPVRISVDAYPSLKLKGRVEKVLLATNSQFSLVPAEGVSGTFIKVSQRLPVRILIEDVPDLPLGPGLSVSVRIRVDGHEKDSP